MLVAAIVGMDNRSTMDLDATLRELPLTEDAIIKQQTDFGLEQEAIDLYTIFSIIN